MYTEKIKIEYKLLLESLENTYSKILGSLENLNSYLNNQLEISASEKFLTEDFYIVLDIIRSQVKNSVYMLKKHKLEQEKNIIYIKSKEIEDIYVDFTYKIDNVFKKD